MPGTISDYLENALLDHILKNTAFSQPAHIYVALSTADPLDTGAGLTEPGNGYARVQHDTWDAAVSRAIANTGAIEFPEATGSWGEITHFAIFDALAGGNMLAHGDLSVSKTIGAGDNASFAAGDIDISFNSGGISDYLANEILDHVFLTGAWSQPTNIYVALTTASIGDSDTGDTITEPSGGSYAREQCNAYDVASGGASENTNAITFTQATASWGTVTYFCLVDALTGGNMLLYAALDTSKAIGTNDTAKFDAGALDITMD